MRPGDLMEINHDPPEDEDPRYCVIEPLILYLYPEPDLTGNALCTWSHPQVGLALGTSTQSMGPDCISWKSSCILLGDVVGWVHSIDLKVFNATR